MSPCRVLNRLHQVLPLQPPVNVRLGQLFVVIDVVKHVWVEPGIEPARLRRPSDVRTGQLQPDNRQPRARPSTKVDGCEQNTTSVELHI